MQLIDILKGIWNHPLSSGRRVERIWRFIAWQIAQRLCSHSCIVPYVNDTRLIIRLHEPASTGNYYLGLMEFEEMGFLLHYLRSGELFCDVGANIGAYTILASGAAGSRSVSFEPVPLTYQGLLDNMSINRLLGGLVSCHNIGIGPEDGELEFTSSQGSANHVCLSSGEGGALKRPVKSLDNALGGELPHFLKVDVEGFETQVIAGARRTLDNPDLNVIILELRGLGTRYGSDELALYQEMIDRGFTPCCYDPVARELTAFKGKSKGDFIFIRDLPKAEKRVKEAKPFDVQGKRI